MVDYTQKVDSIVSFAKSHGVKDWKLESDDESITIIIKVPKE